MLQEEYNKRQVLYNPDEGKSVKREDLKKVDKEYLERTERGLVNRLAERLGVPYGMKGAYLGTAVRTRAIEAMRADAGFAPKVFKKTKKTTHMYRLSY